MSAENVPFNDVPDAALLDASSLQDFLVPMFIMSPPREDRQPGLLLVGSGTLVDVDGNYNILTAAHVWDRVKDKNLGLALTTSYPSGFWMPANSVSANDNLWHGSEEAGSEWGPDLALVRLHPAHIERIKAHKVFLNLSRQRTEFLADPTPKNRVYAMTGDSRWSPLVSSVSGHSSAFETVHTRQASEGAPPWPTFDRRSYLARSNV